MTARIALDGDRLICGICEKSYVHLGSHVFLAHGMDGWEYRRELGLAPNTPLSSERLRERARNDERMAAHHLTPEKAKLFRATQQRTDHRVMADRESVVRASQAAQQKARTHPKSLRALSRLLVEGFDRGEPLQPHVERLRKYLKGGHGG